MKITTKRVYEKPAAIDGRRILVDRLWPRGVARTDAKIDFWAKAISPSTELRKWYGHDAEKWDEFRTRYFKELDTNPEGVAELRDQLGTGTVTLVFSSKETKLNNATALKLYLSRRKR